ncbi:hypothetical protein RSOL_273310 [Rhizoctonia solani AG-3 Rhs1AP]|uniref:Uncharacterized protein n=1 Tax=Rhizoctonia solani AG-3 Rhs1AP TaxID=1086054 RepID=A0A0A1UK06_9AGAM|nr:hypothetical protein RSOL_273310 [Rhizoctonia solani AG-3 Rhs1AP]
MKTSTWKLKFLLLPHLDLRDRLVNSPVLYPTFPKWLDEIYHYPLSLQPVRPLLGIKALAWISHAHPIRIVSPKALLTFRVSLGREANCGDSFTNLVQLLGDKAKSRDNIKKRNSVSPSVSPSRPFNALPKGFKLRLSKRSPARQTHPSIPDQKTPLWMPYTVSLYPNTIILQVPNPGLSSSSKFQIPLSELYDAHSIAAKDLPPGSIPLPGSTSLPPGFGSDIYVFEAQCYGGRIERFAAPTMSLRTTWVRHLLDVLNDKYPYSNNGDGASEKVAKGAISTPNITPTHSPAVIRRLPLVSDLAFTLPGEFLPNPISLTGDTTIASELIGSAFESKPHTEKRLQRLWSSPGNIRATQPMGLPNYALSTPYVRNGSKNYLALDVTSERPEQNDRKLAMLERQTSPSPNKRESVRNRAPNEGSVNWEALSEVRSGRGVSGLSRTTSDIRSPGIRSPFTGPEMVGGAPSPIRIHGNNGILFKPMWPFAEPVTPDGAVLLNDISAKPTGPTLEPGTGLVISRSATGLNTAPRRGLQEVSAPLLSLSCNQPAKSEPKPIQVLGNLPPSNNAETKRSSTPMSTPTQDSSLQPILDRINTLVSALRESDVAHSTKASGLGQLIASTQDHIIQTVEDGAKIATDEHLALVGHLEGLRGTIQSLVDKPSLGIEEQAGLSTIKETIERIDQTISTTLECLSRDQDQEDREEIKGVITQQTDGLKQAIRDLALKLDQAFSQDDILAKLDALAETVTLSGVSPNRDLDNMTEFVQQVKNHISSLSVPRQELPVTEITIIMEKLDSISNSIANPTAPMDISLIQATLEDIRELSQARQTSDAAPVSATQVDMSDVLMKLDGITAICQSIMVARTETNLETDSDGPQEAQQTLLNALKEDVEHRTTQAQQTAELVRYSNVEKFVANASTQMDSVGTGLGALRRDLGLDPPPLTDGQSMDISPQGVIQEFRTMFEEQVKSAADIAASLNALLVAFNEEQAHNAQARENLATDSVLKMIEVQRQEQERLLKQLSSDLSSDIRGERIRFVEAMVQATSMNVQLHVEEFKKQLTHEVLALTDEVGRLREERKTIQHQIAQLFLVKSEHESECHRSDAPPPRPLPSTRPNVK